MVGSCGDLRGMGDGRLFTFCRGRVNVARSAVEPERSRCHKHRDNQAQPLAFTCHGTMGVIADTFAALLADLKRQDEQSRRATQDAINRANKLIADLETMDERWRAEDELI